MTMRVGISGSVLDLPRRRSLVAASGLLFYTAELVYPAVLACRLLYLFYASQVIEKRSQSVCNPLTEKRLCLIVWYSYNKTMFFQLGRT